MTDPELRSLLILLRQFKNEGDDTEAVRIVLDAVTRKLGDKDEGRRRRKLLKTKRDLTTYLERNPGVSKIERDLEDINRQCENDGR